jgi:hypothetical protein
LDDFNAQLKEFRQDDEARWKYEADELQRQSKILKDSGYSDAEFKEELKQAGINVGVLERESEKEVERGKRIHEELRKIQPPPARRTAGAISSGSLRWRFAYRPPPARGWGMRKIAASICRIQHRAC